MLGLSVQKIEKWAQKGKRAKLMGALSNSKKELCLAAIKGLGQCDDPESEAVNALITVLRSPDKDVKIAVMKSLGQLRKELAIEHIRYYTNDKDEDIKNAAVEAIKMINS